MNPDTTPAAMQTVAGSHTAPLSAPPSRPRTCVATPSVTRRSSSRSVGGGAPATKSRRITHGDGSMEPRSDVDSIPEDTQNTFSTGPPQPHTDSHLYVADLGGIDDGGSTPEVTEVDPLSRPLRATAPVDLGSGRGGRSATNLASPPTLTSRSAGNAAKVACAFCKASYSNSAMGFAAYARHVQQRHVSLRVEASHAAALKGVLSRCNCGRFRSAECPCGRPSSDCRPPQTGDTVEGLATRRAPPTRSAAARAAAQASAAGAQANSTLPPTASLIASPSLTLDILQPIVDELDKWNGAETVVNIPVRIRPLLAEIFSGLLSAMTAGNDIAGVLLRCFPKLLLHRKSLGRAGPGAAHSIISTRCTMFLRGELSQLLTMVRKERDELQRVVRKRPRDDAKKPAYSAVRAFARAGAFSKAIKRMSSSATFYDSDASTRWAQLLIPNPPEGTTTLGARPVDDAERARLHTLPTCATPTTAPLTTHDDDGDLREAHSAPPHGTASPAHTPSLFDFAAGVRFGPLSAPGPSGLRGEHLRAFASSRRVASRHAYENAMRAFVTSAIRGTLPLSSCWWITQSSLAFVRKPNASDSDAPRPLRVGEVLRRHIAKRIAAAERESLQLKFVPLRQFGVACPSGSEILIHNRILACERVSEGRGAAMGEWDNDLRNCYGSLYWPAIDTCIDKHVPGALPWTRWCHSDAVRVVLPGGAVHLTQRGAEQGDPLGSIYAAAVIADVCELARTTAATARNSLVGKLPSYSNTLDCIKHMIAEIRDSLPRESAESVDRHLAAVFATTTPSPHDGHSAWDSSAIGRSPVIAATSLKCLDVWYLDDSFVKGDFLDGDLWLAALDAVGSAAGLQRSSTKSSFRPTSPHPAPPYTSLSSSIEDWSAPPKFLGLSLRDLASQFADRTSRVATLHSELRQLDDPAVELVLITQTADLNRITHILRAVGPFIAQSDAGLPPGRRLCGGLSEDSIARFDDAMRSAVAQVARGPVDDAAAQQAAWGTKAGGLGLRSATSSALPSHVASLVETRPYVDWLDTQAELLGIPTTSSISHGSRMNEAVRTLLEQAGESDLRTTLHDTIIKASECAVLMARPILSLPADPPLPPPPPDPDIRLPPPLGSLGGASAAASSIFVPPTDPPLPQPPPAPDTSTPPPTSRVARTSAAAHGPRLQHKLLTILDSDELSSVLTALRLSKSPEHVARHRRLTDLAGDGTSHEWLWAINPAHGFVLPPDDYSTAIRLRLGLPVASFAGSLPCNECGLELTENDVGQHALLCARGRRVIGHNRIRDHVAALAKISDRTTQIEVACESAMNADGVVPLNGPRPADILTSAAPLGGVGSAALDVGITTPFTAEALADLARDPLDDYRSRKLARGTDMCAAAGWMYLTLIISAFGRPHHDTIRTIHRLCVAAARSFGSDPRRTESAWWRNAGTLLMQRAASMVHRCRPRVPASAALGGVDESLWGAVPHHTRLDGGDPRAEALVSGGAAPRTPEGV